MTRSLVEVPRKLSHYTTTISAERTATEIFEARKRDADSGRDDGAAVI